MSDAASLSPPERFNGLIEGLFDDVRARVGNAWFPLAPAELVLIKLIWRRLRRMSRRFAAILARLRAGTLPPAGGASDRAAAAAPARSSEGPRAPAESRRFGWVIYAVSWFVNVRHFERKEMLEDPATVELVAEAPQLGRVLRPLCRMLAVQPPGWLRLPRRARRRPVVEIPPAPEWLVNSPGAMLRPDGSVWMHLGSSRHWRPGFGQTLEQARKLDPPVRVWPREE